MKLWPARMIGKLKTADSLLVAPHWCLVRARAASARAIGSSGNTEALQPVDPWAALVGKDVEGDCRRAPGMKRTADEVTVLLMSLAAAAASYNFGWGRRH
ncbi:hypothetical protein SETIT_8G056300v2 [Setaria italica]|uniref:Uncharacterized protein n=1 Tax=Setaria italica TaxID=4555 RepID=A0A368S4U3_SETIT|nr:hypothetical protein SETIT_8G056300v2 [Setaria italica]